MGRGWSRDGWQERVLNATHLVRCGQGAGRGRRRTGLIVAAASPPPLWRPSPINPVNLRDRRPPPYLRLPTPGVGHLPHLLGPSIGSVRGSRAVAPVGRGGAPMRFKRNPLRPTQRCWHHLLWVRGGVTPAQSPDHTPLRIHCYSPTPPLPPPSPLRHRRGQLPVHQQRQSDRAPVAQHALDAVHLPAAVR